MKQPLMPLHIPPAQAEALYDSRMSRMKGGPDTVALPRDARWPGEDWDDDVPADTRANVPQETSQAASHSA